MTDEQQGGIGCFVILLVIGGCCFYSSSKSEKIDAGRMMDEIVQKAQSEAADKLNRLKREHEAQKKARDDRFKARSDQLLNQIEIERRKEHSAKQMAKERDSKTDELRSFALRESPDIWKTVQLLTAERDSLDGKIGNLVAMLAKFDKDPETDEDVLRLRRLKGQIEEQRTSVMRKLEAAYIAAKKYEAMPQRQEFESLMRKSIEEGISAAEMAERHYKELKGKE